MFLTNESPFDEPKTNSIKNSLGTSLIYQVPKIFPLLSTLYLLERVKLLAKFVYTSHSFQRQQHYAAKILVLCEHYA